MKTWSTKFHTGFPIWKVYELVWSFKSSVNAHYFKIIIYPLSKAHAQHTQSFYFTSNHSTLLRWQIKAHPNLKLVHIPDMKSNCRRWYFSTRRKDSLKTSHHSILLSRALAGWYNCLYLTPSIILFIWFTSAMMVSWQSYKIMLTHIPIDHDRSLTQRPLPQYM